MYLSMKLGSHPSSVGILEFIVDSGFWRGTDVLKGLAFGAKAVMLGRPILYALAAYGSEGVETLIKTVTSELQRTMTMTGVKTSHKSIKQ